MRITFNALVSGLGNNGGTKTLLRSAETLLELGYNVSIAARVNIYNWHTPRVPIIDYVPTRSNIVVAASDLDIVRGQPNTHAWARSWATWNSPDHILSEKYNKVHCIANSTWLAAHIRARVGACGLCYAGLDIGRWYAVPGATITAHARYLAGRKRSKRADIGALLGQDKNLRIEGVAPESNDDFAMCQLYNSTSVWFAPTELEGFHNVPAEANLCGCLVVCRDVVCNGMGDYATPETAHVCATTEDCKQAIVNPDYCKVQRMQSLIREKIGSRKRNMQRFVELLK